LVSVCACISLVVNSHVVGFIRLILSYVGNALVVIFILYTLSFFLFFNGDIKQKYD